MDTKIFRQKSIERVSSPEKLDEYLRVSTPGLWLVLVAVILLLGGACIWGIFGHMETTVDVKAVAENGTVFCYVEETEIEHIAVGMPVRVSHVTGEITKIEPIEDVYRLSVDLSLPDGVYPAVVVTESVHPMFFVFN